jgi:hypothetical protein
MAIENSGSAAIGGVAGWRKAAASMARNAAAACHEMKCQSRGMAKSISVAK